MFRPIRVIRIILVPTQPQPTVMQDDDNPAFEMALQRHKLRKLGEKKINIDDMIDFGVEIDKVENLDGLKPIL